MAEDSFMGGMTSLKTVHDSDKHLASYITLDAIQYYMRTNNPCGMRVLWTSHQPFNYAFSFPKHSPLLPFFNHVYQHVKERGLYVGLKKQWGMVYDESKCASSVSVQEISFKKVVLPFSLLPFGILLALAILLFENLSENHSMFGRPVSFFKRFKNSDSRIDED